MSFREHNCNYICINYMYSIQVQTLKNTICMHIFSFLKQRRYYCVLLFKKILYTTVNARTTSLPERTYSSCKDFTSSGCSSTTSGTKLPDFRQPRLSNSKMQPSATTIDSPFFNLSRRPRIGVNYLETCIILWFLNY